MVDIKFRHNPNPRAGGFTIPEDLETIYIPTEIMKNLTRHYRRTYGLPLKEAKRMAALFLEEISPHILSHESVHLALGHVAQKERLPVAETMLAYHNPLVEELEDVTETEAQRRAIERALVEFGVR